MSMIYYVHMKRSKGFTIVEVAVVIVILAILVTLTALGFNRTMSNSRNDSTNSKGKLIATALEKYYNQNGEYPTCDQLRLATTSNIGTTYLPGVEGSTVTRDGAASGTNSIACTSPTTGNFAYTSTGNVFTLQYKEEATGNIVTFNSQHITTGDTPNKPVLAVEFVGTNIVATATTPACLVGQLQYDFRVKVNDAASWPAYDGTYVTSNTASQAFTQGYRYAYQVRAQCSGSSTFIESDPSPTVTAEVTAPSTPTLTAVISGSNVIGTLGTVTCPPQTTAYYRLQWKDRATSGGGTWSGWPAWQTTQATNTHAANQGWKTSYQGQTYCKGMFSDSGIVETGYADAIRPMSQPAAPTWAGVSGWTSGYNASRPGIATYNTYCPTGAWTTRQWFYSIAWNGIRFDHDFPYNDWWYTGSITTKFVEYHAWYTCATDYASATSAESYITGMPVWP